MNSFPSVSAQEGSCSTGEAQAGAAPAAARLRAARRGLSEAARGAPPEALGALGGATLAISAHEVALEMLAEAAPGPLGAPAEAALEASALAWAALGVQAARVAALFSGPSATEAGATAALTQ